MRLASNAVIMQGDHNLQPDALKPGTLVTVTFNPSTSEAPTVRQIAILATPGTGFVFAGRIEHLDLRRGLVVIMDPRDNKSYDVYFDPASHSARELRQGADERLDVDIRG